MQIANVQWTYGTSSYHESSVCLIEFCKRYSVTSS